MPVYVRKIRKSHNYDIAPLAISFPKTVGEQTQIVDKLERLSAETQNLESNYQRKLAALDELKQLLPHRAFRGEL